MPLPEHVSNDRLTAVVRDIWTTMLGLDATPRSVPEFGDLERPVYTGCVQITGPWEGAVVVDCPAGLARRAASTMLGITEAECSAADLHDVVGEIANMVGGNVKALVPEGCRLSLPAVTEGVDYLVTVPGARIAASAGFDCAGVPLRVTVHQRR